jgi:asparagine synthase (glutamine-hydrolysing)
MCSIFGIISFDQPISGQIADNFIRTLNHRGPDDHGIFHDNNVMIGMNRLSIIDLGTGHQPISNEDDSLQICFNGEIYNYLELRKDLIDKGHNFKTSSDTEVILHLFEEYGEGCLQKLNGMFAFVIWDRKREKAFVSRDPLGIKPLYYVNKGGCFYFASELKAILAVVPDLRKLDDLALSRYFSFGYIPSPQTPFSDVKKLPAGHYLVYDKRGIALHSYWNIQLGESESVSESNIDHEILEISSVIRESVKMELMSDVPLGCFLSGGVDSSAIVALAQDCINKPLHTFCFKFAESTHDESSDAAIVARHLKSIHHEIEFSQNDILENLYSIADSMDEPFADSTYLTLSLLSCEVRKSVKVILTGMGGDEVFTGYPTIKAHQYMHYYRKLPNILGKRIIPSLANRLPVSNKYFSLEFKAKRFVRGQNYPGEIQHFIWMEYFSLEDKRKLLGDFAPEASVMDTYSIVEDELERCDAKTLMNRILYLDMKFFLENNGLFQVDRATMAHSLEARVPLLNARLLDKMFKVPFGFKYYKGQSKYPLRQAIRSMLPNRVFVKPKKGFGPPVSSWLRTFLKGFLLETLSKSQLSHTPLSYTFISRMIDEHLKGEADHGRALWLVLIFQIWWNKYQSGSLVR